MSDTHSLPIKTWQQLVAVAVAALVVPVIVIAMIAALVTSGTKGTAGDESALLARIQPVGSVELATSSGPRSALSGEQVYAQVCKTCHEAGLAGAPKHGDKGGWARVIAQGEKLTVEHAIKGIKAMPPKGGNPDLTDNEVHAAVVHMVNAAGGRWKAPPAPAAQTATGGDRTGNAIVALACAKCHETGAGGAPRIGDRAAWLARAKRGLDAVYASALKGHAGMPARGGMAEFSDVEVKRAVEFMLNAGAAPTAAAVAPPAPAAPAALASAASATARPDGKKVYETACVACHATGVANAPKLGDKAAWAPRLKTGQEALYASVVKGKGAMPPKGGNTTLSDADVKAAVDFMAASVK